MIKELEYEQAWWGTCQNTVMEEVKQLAFAKEWGLELGREDCIEMNGEKILDIGGGPSSLLLKCRNINGKVVDPCDYPQWTKDRYKLAGIELEMVNGEDINETGYDEVWIYNVLQHVINPQKVAENALKAGKVRVMEMLNVPIHNGHPHLLTEEKLNNWFKKEGRVVHLPGLNLEAEYYWCL